MTDLEAFLQPVVADPTAHPARIRALVERYRFIVEESFAGESMGMGYWDRTVHLVDRRSPVRLGFEVIEEHGWSVLVPYVLAAAADECGNDDDPLFAERIDEEEVHEWCGARLFVVEDGPAGPTAREAGAADVAAQCSHHPVHCGEFFELSESLPGIALRYSAAFNDGTLSVEELTLDGQEPVTVPDDPDQASTDLYGRAVDLAPADATLRVERGDLREEGGDLAGALADYDEAVRLAPDDLGIRFGRAMVRSAAGDVEGELTDYGHVLAVDPRHLLALGNRGLEYLRQGRVDEALTDLRTALEAHPDDPWVLRCLASAHLARGDRDRSMELLTRAAALDPAGTREDMVGSDFDALRDDSRFLALRTELGDG